MGAWGSDSCSGRPCRAAAGGRVGIAVFSAGVHDRGCVDCVGVGFAAWVFGSPCGGDNCVRNPPVYKATREPFFHVLDVWAARRGHRAIDACTSNPIQPERPGPDNCFLLLWLGRELCALRVARFELGRAKKRLPEAAVK